MIYEDELQYINKKSCDVPYPGDIYAYETINYITYALVIFKQKYEGKKFNILLNNGEEIFLEIKGKNLANLLGIDYRTIVRNQSFRNVLGYSENEYIDPYELLSRIVDKGSSVIAHDEVNNNKILNYYTVMVRISYFLKLSSFNKFDFGVINFNKETYERSFNKKVPVAPKKILLFPNNDEIIGYCMMGLNYEKESSVMVPETFIVSKYFPKIMYRQEFLLPKEILIDNNEGFNRLKISPTERIQLLNLYKSIILTYNTKSFIKNDESYKRGGLNVK